MSPAYLDPRSGATFSLDEPRWCGPAPPGEAGAPLLLTPLPGCGREAIDAAARGPWRYRAALPLPAAEPITLGEGGTPLLPVSLYGARALLKLDFLMPTGSFKDRGTAVMLSLLRAQGVRAVVEDSSGNAGASIAAYAAAGGLAATIVTPASASPAKLLQARACGAQVETVDGDRDRVAAAAMARAARGAGFYASHNWHPFFLHGVKSLAYELWEALGFRAPANVIAPCGAGSIVLGLEIGFGELLRAGAIDTLPRLFAAQPAACAPVAASFQAGEAVEILARPSMAEGTAIARPVRLPELLGALAETRGGAVMVEETEIARATLDLAALGVLVEPTSALAAAAFAKLLASGAVADRQETVLVLTGSGLKAADRIAALLSPAQPAP